MPLIMFLNLKGGVAKTTNALAVAECFASQKKSVLLLDADHQSLSGELVLGRERLFQAETSRRTLHDLLSSMLSDEFRLETIERYVAKRASNVSALLDYMDCLPCSHRIDEFSTNMARARKGFQSTEDFLRRLNQLRHGIAQWCNCRYDYTIIDCPPSFVLQVLFFLGCSEYFILPSIPDPLSVRGSLYLMERLWLRGYRRIVGLGTLWSMVRKQVANHLEIMEQVRRKCADYAVLPEPFHTVIPNTSALADLTNSDDPYSSFRAKYQTATARLFENLCREIEERIRSQTVKKDLS